MPPTCPTCNRRLTSHCDSKTCPNWVCATCHRYGRQANINVARKADLGGWLWKAYR